MAATGQVTEEVSTPARLWDPVQNPEALRAAASAWTDLGSALSQAATGLGQIEARLRLGWSGAAATAFDAWASAMVQALQTAAGECQEVAGKLQEAAEAIDKANEQIHQLYLAVAATAVVAIAATVITFGLSDAAEAAGVAAAAAEAGSLLATLAATLTAISEAVTAYTAGMLARWAAGALLTGAFVEGYRLGSGQGLGLSASDGKTILNGALSFALIPGGLAEGKPLLAGALGGAGSRTLDDLEDGKAPTVQELGVSAAFGAVFSKAFSFLPVSEGLGIQSEPETSVDLGDPLPGQTSTGSGLIQVPQQAPITFGGQTYSVTSTESGLLVPQTTSVQVGAQEIPVTTTASGLLVPQQPGLVGLDGAPLTSGAAANAPAPVAVGTSGGVAIGATAIYGPDGTLRPILTTTTPADPVFVQSMGRALDPLGDWMTTQSTNAVLATPSPSPNVSGTPVTIPPAPDPTGGHAPAPTAGPTPVPAGH